MKYAKRLLKLFCNRTTVIYWIINVIYMCIENDIPTKTMYLWYSTSTKCEKTWTFFSFLSFSNEINTLMQKKQNKTRCWINIDQLITRILIKYTRLHNLYRKLLKRWILISIKLSHFYKEPNCSKKNMTKFHSTYTIFYVL